MIDLFDEIFKAYAFRWQMGRRLFSDCVKIVLGFLRPAELYGEHPIMSELRAFPLNGTLHFLENSYFAASLQILRKTFEVGKC